jgi:hypothetical protein
MRHIIGFAAAAALVLLQLGVVAAWSVEPPLDLAPIEGSQSVEQHA